MPHKRKIDLARFGAWAQERFERFCAKHLTIGGATRFVFTSLAFFAVSLWPTMRAEHLDWKSWGGGWGKALHFAWIPFVAALYLKYSEGMKRARIWDKL